MNQRVIVFFIIVAIFFAGGIWFANLLPNKYQSQLDTSLNTALLADRQALFSDLRLGTPARGASMKARNLPIRQKLDYSTEDPIMLQGTTTTSVTEPVRLSVRLIDASSKTSTLTPENITLDPGTSSFCCWNITAPGTYTIQVLRPDSITTRLPITITRD